ncbi:MAG: hypothetical protein AVDCRST_MAG07-3353, partial [uncultured Frankineae bacterium]
DRRRVDRRLPRGRRGDDARSPGPHPGDLRRGGRAPRRRPRL